MQTDTKTIWLVAAGEDEEALSLTDVSVYLTEAEAREAADELVAYLGNTFVFVQKRVVG